MHDPTVGMVVCASNSSASEWRQADLWGLEASLIGDPQVLVRELVSNDKADSS